MADRLVANQSLAVNDWLTSQDGRFKLILQHDGNLVLYGPGFYGPGSKPLWASNTGKVVEARMRADGNFVLLPPTERPGRPPAPVWTSNTGAYPGAWLIVQSDGNVVIYDVNCFSRFSTGTAVPSTSPDPCQQIIDEIQAALVVGVPSAVWLGQMNTALRECRKWHSITEWTLPNANSGPWDISPGPDGKLWFTENLGNRIGRITVDGIFDKEVDLPNSGPYIITSGPDGKIWFTETGVQGQPGGNQIERMTVDGVIDGTWGLSMADSKPRFITVSAGNNLWFVEAKGNRIGRITFDGTMWNKTEFPPLPLPSGPSGIVFGPDCNLWVTETLGNQIRRISLDGTPNGAPFGLFNPSSGPTSITVGPDKNLWFTEHGVGMGGKLVGGQRIGRITPGGVITEWPTAGHPTGISVGPDGNLWFAERDKDIIGVIDPVRTNLIEIHLSDYFTDGIKRGPFATTPGPDGNVWFTETDINKIGRLDPRILRSMVTAL